jgi:hypothetical protein
MASVTNSVRIERTLAEVRAVTRSSLITALLMSSLCASCADSEVRDVRILDYYEQAGGRELVTTIDACGGSVNRVDVREEEDAVYLSATTDAPTRGNDCTEGVIVSLDEPLGGRAVIDALDQRTVSTQF